MYGCMQHASRCLVVQRLLRLVLIFGDVLEIANRFALATERKR